MHIETAILSTAVCATLGAVQAGAAARAVRAEALNPTGETDSLSGERASLSTAILATLLVFALQMGNVSIPGTGSSGHVIGAVFLALVLGSGRAFLAMGAILAVQAFFFHDGGVEALGANWFNMGLVPCLVVYPLVRRHSGSATALVLVAPLAASVLGALAASAEIALSGNASIGAASLFAHMAGIHFLIGLGEALATWAVVGAAALLSAAQVRAAFAAAAFGIALVSANYASQAPDGLEWSLQQSVR